ncbi:MAG: hypothetical protein CSB47_04080 [Proteobacteria bacterium]|nr:MAG: hypothetical protein CSB47_04080 [Pseudomonadota bacterium]
MSSQICSPLLSYVGLQKQFGSRDILNAINVTLQRGECHLLLGENGAGKTTLLRIMAGLLKPEAGHISVNKRTLCWLRARPLLRDKVMYLHQMPYLFDGSVLQNLKYAVASSSSGMCSSQRNASIEEVLEWSGLAALVKCPAKQLSGGEKQRLALARARLRRAPVLLLDEPTSNMDSESLQKTLALLASLKALGTCMLIACHEPSNFMEIADGEYQLSAGDLHSWEV